MPKRLQVFLIVLWMTLDSGAFATASSPSSSVTTIAAIVSGTLIEAAPTLLLNSDGSYSVVTRGPGYGFQLFTGRLKPLVLNDVMRVLRKSITFKGLRNFYNLQPQTHDLPDTNITIRTPEFEKSVTVRAFLNRDSTIGSTITLPGTGHAPDPLPVPFVKLYDFLTSIPRMASSPWETASFTLDLLAVEGSEKRVVAWPQDLPKPPAECGIRGSFYRYDLAGRFALVVNRLLLNLGADGAVFVAGGVFVPSCSIRQW